MSPWEDLQHEREKIQEVREATKEQIDRNAEQEEVKAADMTAVNDFVAADLAVGAVQMPMPQNQFETHQI